MSKTTIARVAPPRTFLTDVVGVENTLGEIARRLRAIVSVLEEQCAAESICEQHPIFEVLLDAIKSEAGQIEDQRGSLAESRKAAVA